MYRLVAISSVLIFAGCAASEPPAEVSGAPEPVAQVSPPAAETGEIVFAEAPAVPEQAVPVQPDAPVVVCQLERRTGTNRKVRVCRQQSTAADSARAQETFDSLRRQQVDLHQ